jgi:hypothetical protein
VWFAAFAETDGVTGDNVGIGAQNECIFHDLSIWLMVDTIYINIKSIQNVFAVRIESKLNRARTGFSGLLLQDSFVMY